MKPLEGKINSIQVFRLKIPLNAPYHLSLGQIDHFGLFLARVRIGDREGLGETVPLRGYSHETDELVWRLLQKWSDQLLGTVPEEALSLLRPEQEEHPFAAAAVVTAIETALEKPEFSEDIEVPLLGTVMAHHDEDPVEKVESLLGEGYTTLKVKVGWDEKEDASRVRSIQKVVGDRGLIRLDANQAYHLDQAIYLARHVDPGNIELFEQPFGVDDWDAMTQLSQSSPLPLMLDESITSEAELEKAIRLRCAQVVKFKLMKAGGLEALKRLILRAKEAGLKVVMGNGVAGDIGNLHELSVAANHVETTGEMNGFLKQRERLLKNPYITSRGRAVLPRDYAPEVDWEKVERYSVATLPAIR